jgi:hypothetical protein
MPAITSKDTTEPDAFPRTESRVFEEGVQDRHEVFGRRELARSQGPLPPAAQTGGAAVLPTN